MIIIFRFGEGNVFGPIYIDIYIHFWDGRGDRVRGLPYISRLLFIKAKKTQEHDLS